MQIQAHIGRKYSKVKQAERKQTQEPRPNHTQKQGQKPQGFYRQNLKTFKKWVRKQEIQILDSWILQAGVRGLLKTQHKFL